jgi:hypothetical protein
MVNRYQVDLNGFSGSSWVALVGGIGAMLVGTAFFVAGCLHLEVLRQTSCCVIDQPPVSPFNFLQSRASRNNRTAALTDITVEGENYERRKS